MRAVLFIHGLSAKTEDNKYFLEAMKKYKNIDIYSFILPGHENDKITKCKRKEWLNKSEQELKKILKNYSKVTIVAHSMGTIIAVNLASKYKEVEKLVLIAPAFQFGSFKQNKKDLKNILKGNIDKNVGTGFEGSFKKFIEIPKSVMIEYYKMSTENRDNIPKIKCPTLVMHGEIDSVIPIESSKYVYNNLKCIKDLVIIKNVRHQVFKSNKKDIITKYIYSFITFNILYEFNKKREI